MPTPKMTPEAFVNKWNQMFLTESASAQSHFMDICDLVGHPHPTDLDPTGEFFTFEAAALKPAGGKGRADAYYQGHFIWEYKGPHKDLDKAYQQLQLYREALGNPPLLITSDTRDIIIHTNFTNTASQTFVIDFPSILDGRGIKLLWRAFHDPATFYDPNQAQDTRTKATANTFVAVAEALQKYTYPAGQTPDPERLAHFIIRLLFALFAEDMHLLPDRLFTNLVEYTHSGDPTHLAASLKNLFGAMRAGGVFGFHRIPNFDGGLFDDDYVPPGIPSDLTRALARACRQDWSAIDPSIFGTLFERIIDQSKRAQLGAHYTSKEDILLIVEPVLMQPLIREWEQVRITAYGLLQQGQREAAATALQAFSDKVAATRVLDPACGSGNFLYVALRRLLDLQKEIIAFAARNDLPDIPLTVGPHQLYGIEINAYAHELAQITIWIGYLQWRLENGFPEIDEPILKPLRQIEHKDAILAYDADGKPVEPEWPEAEVIVGNPPFLGSQRMRGELGNQYLDALYMLYGSRLPGQSDLVCYWFEKARAMIQSGQAQRAGLIATNSIRGGGNRTVLERIKASGDIFMAWSNLPWILEGAAVRVSIIGFDKGVQRTYMLDGDLVACINPDLTSHFDLTQAIQLPENANLAYQGPVKIGAFDIDQVLAQKMLAVTNQSGRSNADVIRPWVNGLDITRRPRNMYIIDFNERPLEEATLYEQPLEYVRQIVKPSRDENRRERRQHYWWLHGETVPSLRNALTSILRYIITPRVSKYRLFVWMGTDVLPDSATIAIMRDDNYFFGVLHSKIHELWALRQGTSLEDRPRYTPTTTFETYPFPWSPGQEPTEAADPRVAAIAQAARDLVAFRDHWQYPPKEEIGVTISERQLKQRTLTNLYNALTYYREHKGHPEATGQYGQAYGALIPMDDIVYLDHIHTTLDHAVLDAYGWPHHLSDDQILEHLLALNLERAKAQQ